LMSTCLKQAGYSVIEAGGGPEALSLFQQYKTGIALVVSDIQMAEMSGVDLAEQLLQLRPGLPIMFVTASGDVLPQAMRRFWLVQKPFRLHELMRGIEASLSGLEPWRYEPVMRT